MNLHRQTIYDSSPVQRDRRPPYLLGLLGLIPLVGFFVGIGLLLYGTIKYKDKKLTIIGIACILFTVLVYSSLFYIGLATDIGKKGWQTSAEVQLNSIIKDIEYYKLENGKYPDSLQQLTGTDQVVFIYDPTQTALYEKAIPYNYQNLGNKYLLFSSGIDKIAHTKDDIFPRITNPKSAIGWVRTAEP